MLSSSERNRTSNIECYSVANLTGPSLIFGSKAKAYPCVSQKTYLHIVTKTSLNKLECLSLTNTFMPSLILESKTGAYQS